MCDYCLNINKVAVSSVYLKDTKGLWTDKPYRICQSCKDYLSPVYKYVDSQNKLLDNLPDE